MPDMVAKPRLVPFAVPWMVSPSAPFLRLVALEGNSAGETFVEFVAYSPPFESPPHGGNSLQIVHPPGMFRGSDASESAPYRHMRVTFQRFVSARMCPAHSDREVVEESVFDWSCVPGRWRPGESIELYLRRDRELWQTTGMCPDPLIYHTKSSPWIDSLQLQYGSSVALTHYLVLGHDAYVEVIAECHSVEYGQPLDVR
jgi:hypothetical protein